MNSDIIFYFVTLIVEWLFGIFSKKKNVNTDLIPYQNLIIGLVVAIIEWFITKDFNVAIAVSGLFAGGVYDLVHNISKMNWYQKWHKKTKRCLVI